MMRMRHLAMLPALAVLAIASVGSPVRAAGGIPAGIELTHYAPVNGKVSATMIGKSFRPKERVHVTYRATVRTISVRRYTFEATTDGVGAFYRTVRFKLGNPSYGYAIRVTAAGERGDRATFSTWASGRRA